VNGPLASQGTHPYKRPENLKTPPLMYIEFGLHNS